MSGKLIQMDEIFQNRIEIILTALRKKHKSIMILEKKVKTQHFTSLFRDSHSSVSVQLYHR